LYISYTRRRRHNCRSTSVSTGHTALSLQNGSGCTNPDLLPSSPNSRPPHEPGTRPWIQSPDVVHEDATLDCRYHMVLCFHVKEPSSGIQTSRSTPGHRCTGDSPWPVSNPSTTARQASVRSDQFLDLVIREGVGQCRPIGRILVQIPR